MHHYLHHLKIGVFLCYCH